MRIALILLSGLASSSFSGVVSAASLDDTFDGNALDGCRWEDTSNQAAVSQTGQLVNLSIFASGFE